LEIFAYFGISVTVSLAQLLRRREALRWKQHGKTRLESPLLILEQRNVVAKQLEFVSEFENFQFARPLFLL
jgi:hypothetical protein